MSEPTPDNLLAARVLIRQALALLDAPAAPADERPVDERPTSTHQGTLIYPGPTVEASTGHVARWPQQWLGQPVQLGADEFAVLTALNANASPDTNTFTGGARELEHLVHMGGARLRTALAALSSPMVNGRGLTVREPLVRRVAGKRGRQDWTLVLPAGAITYPRS